MIEGSSGFQIARAFFHSSTQLHHLRMPNSYKAEFFWLEHLEPPTSTRHAATDKVSALSSGREEYFTLTFSAEVSRRNL
jgi:hypothetical protein